MAVLPENVDYTDKDQDSIRLRLVNLMKSAFTDWTDFNTPTWGNILLESFAHVVDIALFYMDNQAREAFITDVQLRRNAISLAKRLGFVPQGASASTVDVLFTLGEVPSNDVVIPAGTVVKTADVTDAVRFQLLLDLTIPSSTDPPQAFGTVENSEDSQDTFSSSGLANQEVVLNSIPFLDGSALVTAGNGAYMLVDNFLSSDANDRHYTIVVDENDRATLRFGNSVNGEIPTGIITVDYKTGGGGTGNVDVNTVSLIEGSFTDVLSNPVTVTVNNPSAASGGSNRQTVEQIKQLAPEELRVLNRTVSREDYEIGARGVAGVARALMLTSDQAVGSIPENNGFLYVVPDGGGTPSQTLKDDVLTAVTVTKPNTVTFKVSVVDPKYKTIDVNVTVFLEQGRTESSVKSSILQALEDYFAISNDDGTPNTNVDFGYNKKNNDGTPAAEFPLSDLLCLVEGVTGVRKIGDNPSDLTMNGSHSDLTLLLFEFPRLGDVVIVNGETGEQI